MAELINRLYSVNGQKTLRKYIIDGYTINGERIAKKYNEFLSALEKIKVFDIIASAQVIIHKYIQKYGALI